MNANKIKKRKKPLTLFKLSQKLHKWLMLFIGAQFVIWSITGAYMVFFDIDYIHGDNLVITHQNTIKPENLTYPSQALFQQYPRAKNLSVGLLIDREVYRFNNLGQQLTVDARTGELLSPLDKENAIAIAKHAYSGDSEVINVELITHKPPFELNARHLPVWRIDFDHFESPTLYVSTNSGTVVTKRHNFWRLFDWMFRFHIMEYAGESDVSNWLLFIMVLLALLAALSGLVLTYVKMIKPLIFPSKNRQNTANKIQKSISLPNGEQS